MVRGLLFLSLLFAAPGFAANETKHCPYAEAAKPKFTDWIDVEAAAAHLIPQWRTVVYKSQPFVTTSPDGSQIEIKMGRGTTSEKTYLTLTKNGQEVSHLTSEYNAEKNSLWLTETKTTEDFLRQGGSDALFKVLFAVHSEVKNMGGRFSWFNFQRVAEGLAGQEVKSVAEQQTLIIAALAQADKGPLVKAVEESPTGRIMKRLGFKVDPGSLEYTPPEQTDKGDPLLEVRWSR